MQNLLPSRPTGSGILQAAPSALIAALACSLAWNQTGSIARGDWLLYAVVTSLLLAAVLLSGRAALPSAPGVVALCGLFGLALFDTVSLTWSAVPDLARDEALLVSFYAAAFAVPMLTLRNEAERRLAASGAAILLCLLSIGTLIAVRFASDPTVHYEGGRLTFPISYVNAQGALEVVAFWPAVALAANRTSSLLTRGLAVGGATALLGGWLLTQSKGAGLSLLAGALFVFAVSTARLRLLVATLIPLALIGASYSPLTAPFRHRANPGFADSIRSATTTTIGLAAAAVLLGLLYATVDVRVDVSPRARRSAGFAAAALAAIAAVACIAAFFAVVDHPGRFAHDRWASFKTYPAKEQGSSHLVNLGSNRYDFWRVDLRLFADHPIGGVGARGFAPAYLLQRRSGETPQRGHSLELDTLAETGIIGLGLLAVALVGALAAAIPPSRRSLTAAGCGAAGACWIAQAAVDWTWTVPASGVTAFLLLGIASARTGAPQLRNRFAIPLAVLAIGVAFGAFVPPWLSARLTRSALANRASPATDIRWAKRLDPLSVDPYVAESFLAASRREAVAPLLEAVSKQPRNAALRFQLGRAYLAAGERDRARRALLVAERLDPRDELIRRFLRRASP